MTLIKQILVLFGAFIFMFPTFAASSIKADDLWPFPWGTECPFPWDTIDQNNWEFMLDGKKVSASFSIYPSLKPKKYILVTLVTGIDGSMISFSNQEFNKTDHVVVLNLTDLLAPGTQETTLLIRAYDNRLKVINGEEVDVVIVRESDGYKNYCKDTMLKQLAITVASQINCTTCPIVSLKHQIADRVEKVK